VKEFIVTLKHVTIDAVKGVSERKLAIEQIMSPRFRDSQYLLYSKAHLHPNDMFVPLPIKKQLSIENGTIFSKKPCSLALSFTCANRLKFNFCHERRIQLHMCSPLFTGEAGTFVTISHKIS